MAILGFPSTSIIDSTLAGRALLTAANAAAQRTLLGLGTSDTPTFTALVLAGQSLTGSSSTSVFDASTTWNTTGTPTAIKLNVTDTASNVNSLLLDLQVGGVSVANITKTGLLTVTDKIAFSTVANQPRLRRVGQILDVVSNDETTYGTLRLGSLRFSTDTYIIREAAYILALQNGLNPHAFRIYNTFTSSTNYERGKLAWEIDGVNPVLRIGTEKGSGGGTARALQFQTDGATRVSVSALYPQLSFGTDSGAPILFSFSGSSFTSQGNGRGISIFSSSNTANDIAVAITGDTVTTTTGSYRNAHIYRLFAPTSGTCAFTLANFQAVINQTGGANGITRGVYVSPTLTAATDWRSIETSNNTGWAFYGAGTADSYFGGRIGIGNAAPSYALDISGTTPAIRVNNASGNQRILVGSDGSGSYVGTFSNHPLRFFTNSLEQARITTSGDFGIATTSPSQKLHVEGNIRVTGAYYDSTNSAGTSGQVLKSTATGTDWVDPYDLVGVNADFVKTVPGNRFVENLQTGVLYGGVITINALDNTKIDISAGAGIIVSMGASTTAMPVPTVTTVTWTAKTAVTLTYLATNDVTWFALDSSGNVVQSTAAWSDTGYETQLCLGIAVHPDNTSINFTKQSTHLSYGQSTVVDPFVRAFGPLKLSGNTISAYSNNLQIKRSAGTAYALGANYVNDPNNPNIVADTDANPITQVCYYYHDGLGGFNVQVGSLIDPTKYDNQSGTLQTASGGKYTIQRLFSCPTQPTLIGVYYGSQEYNSIEEAEANIPYESFAESELTSKQGLFCGYLIVKANSTNLSNAADAKFIQAGLFRSISTVTAGGQAITSLDDLTDVVITSPVQGNFLRYNAATSSWVNGTGVDGTGTTNYVPKWSDSDTLANSLVFDDGASVGVAATTLAARFHVKGSGNTSATNALNIENSTGTNIFRVRDDGVIHIGPTTSTSNGAVISCSDGTDNLGTTTLSGLRYRSSLTTSAAGSDHYFRNYQGSRTQTSGTSTLMELSGGFAPTSGTGNYVLFRGSTTINQTGGANGATYGILLSPTLTAAADFRAIETTNGPWRLTDTYASGSGSLAGPAMVINQTWNTAGTPTAISLNVTDTNSNSASRLLDLRLGGTSRVAIDKSGSYLASNPEHASTFDCSSSNSNTVSERYFRYGGTNSDLTSVLEVAYLGGTVASPSAPVTGRYINSFTFRTGGTNAALSSAISFAIRHTVGSTIGSTLAEVSTSFIVNSTGTGVPFSALDLIGQTGHVRIPIALRVGASGSESYLYPDAANILAQRNAINPQTFRLYNTFTDASNFERGFLRWSSNVLQLGIDVAGTGVTRGFGLFVAGANRLSVSTSGFVGIGNDSPGTTFHVGAGSSLSIPDGVGGAFTPQVLHTATSGIVGIGCGIQDGTNNRRIGFFVNQTSGVCGIGHTVSTGFLPFIFDINGERMRIISTGEVGIGTNAPIGRLHVADTTLAGSGSLAGSLLNLSQTWNTTGTPTAILLNVTDTASNAASLLMDLRVGGTSRFNVTKSGVLNLSSQVNAAVFAVSGGAGATINSTRIGIGSGVSIDFSSTASAAGLADSSIVREAVGILAQRNALTPQAFRLYNTFTDASNYERAKIAWESNTLRIGVEVAGTGTSRALEFQTNGATRLTISASGVITTQNALYVGSTSNFIINASANAPSVESVFGTTQPYSPTSGSRTVLNATNSFAPTSGTATYTGASLSPTVNQTGGANGITRGLYVNPTLTAAADWRSVETANNTGWAIYAAGTANSYFGGSVGIGTTSPSEALHVNGRARIVTIDNGAGDFATISATGVITRRTAAQVLTDIGAQAALTNPVTGTGANGRVAFWTGTTTQSSDSAFFWDNTNKRLGIGTATPSVVLHVQNGSSGFAQDSVGGLFIENNGTSNSFYVFQAATAGGGRFFNLSNAGNVGIGAISPKGRLNVASNSSAVVEPVLGASTNATAIFANSANLYGLNFVVSGTGVVYLQNQRFDTTTTTYPLILNGLGGNVGIGSNNNPTQPLHVTGNVRITGAYYDSNNDPGTSGQVLSSTATGTNWVSLSEITGVDGTGTANYLAKWSDADTITNSQLFDNGTNIGIGTTSPANKIHIRANSGGFLRLGINDANADTVEGRIDWFSNEAVTSDYFGGLRMRFQGGSGANNRQMQFLVGDSATPRVVITGQGFLGVGTTTPDRGLVVTGSNATTLESAIFFNSNTTSGAEVVVRLGVFNSSAGLALRQSTNVTGPAAWASGSYDSFIQANQSGSKLHFAAGGNASPQVTLWGGNLGIGTVSPGSRLTIDGGEIAVISTSANPTLTLTDTTAGNDPFIRFVPAVAANSFAIGIDDSDADKFKISYGSSAALGVSDRLTIDTSGNIGIATTNPKTRLHVALGNYALISQSFFGGSHYHNTNGLLIRTDIAVSDNRMFELTIEGNSYNDSKGPIFARVQAYNFTTSGTIINTTAFSTDPTFTIDVFHYDGFVYFWFAQTSSFQTYTLKLISPMAEHVISQVSNAAKPTTGVTNSVTITPAKLWNSLNDGAGSGLDADTLDGQQLSSIVSGATNYIPKFTGANAVGNSQLFDNGTNVGIGTTSPARKLHVNGDIQIDQQIFSAQSYVGFLTTASAAQAVKVGSLAITSVYTNNAPANGLYVQGDVGIGTTSPSQKLEVVGDINVASGSGFRINNTATAGQYLRGNGTRFVSSVIQAADVPTLNQSTTGNAATATTLQTARLINGTSFNGSADITTANWGTSRTITIGATGKSVNGSANVSWSLSEIGATTVGSNLFTLTDPSAIRFLRINADNTISTLTDADFRTAIGVGTGTGTVISIATNNGITGGTITVSGTIGLTGQALALHNLATNGIIVRTAADTIAARTISAGTGISISNGDGVAGNPTITNTDLGSSQNIFKNIAVSGQSTVIADSNDDTLTLVAGSNVTITTNAATDTITISATDTNTTYTGSTSIILSSTSFERAALTGDVTASQNSNATTIANNAVSNAKLADMATSTIKGRATAGTGDPEDLTAAQVRTILNVADGATANTGTVTSIATNNGITGGTITVSGTIGLTGQALAFHNLATNGIVARTAADTVTARTITGTTNQITVTNGDGVSGNPTLSLPQNIHTAATPTFAGATLNGNLDLRAASTVSVATQIPVFIADPSTTTRTLVTRTPAQLRSDIGAQAVLTNPVTGTGTSGQVSFWSGTTTQSGDNGLFWDNTNKRLGIGTTTPTGVLEVLRTNTTAGQRTTPIDVLYVSAQYEGGDGLPYLGFGGGLVFRNETYNNGTRNVASIYGIINDLSTGFNGGSIIFRTADTVSVDPTTKMIIRYDGNVGIGTISPGSKLTIDGGEISVISTSANPTLTLTDTSAGNDPYIRFVPSTSSSAFAIGIDDSDSDKFKISYGSNAVLGVSDFFTIDVSGNVGIGTTSPSQRLHIAGDINVSSGSGFRINDTATSGQYLRGDGTRFVASTIQASDVPTLNQNTTGTASNVTGTVAVANGGTGATTAPNARTNLGATTVGSNLFTVTDPSAIRFLRINADNTVSTLTDADFRTAIGVGTGTGTVLSIATTDGITGGTITTSGTIGLTGQALALHNLATNGIIARTGAGTVSARTISAGTGISISNGDGVSGNPTITNSDLGSSQNIFKNIAVSGQSTVVADSNDDTLTLVAGSNVTITTNATTDTITISATDTNTTYTGSTSVILSATSFERAALTGDVTASQNSNATTIANDAVSNTKLANMATSTIKGRATAGTGDPEDLTAAQVRTILNVADGATANTGTVTSVSGTGTVSGLTLTGTVTTTGNLTLGGTLSVTPSNFASQTANTFLAAPNGTAGVPSFRAIVAADIPTLNQNTTGTAANVTGTVAVANGGTGATTAPNARTNLGATTVGNNLFILTNPSAITFLRVNADNSVSALNAADFRTAIGAGVGTVTSIATANGVTGGFITSTGTIELTGQALALHNLATNGIIVRTGAAAVAARTITGTANQITVTNGDGVAGNPTLALPQNIHTAATPTFAGASFNGDIELRASVTASAATQILVFIADPSSTTRRLYTRTPTQLLSDIGAQAALTNPVTGTGSSGQISFWSGTNAQSGDNDLFWDNANKRLGVSTTSPGSSVDIKGTLRLSGATSGYVGFAPAAAAGSTTYTLPASDGTADQVLKTDGAGNLSWTTPTGGGITNEQSIINALIFG